MLILFFFLFFFCFFFLFLFYFINFFFSFKESSSEGVSSFESGFQSIGLVQSSFSIHFFLIFLMFVVFDVELVLLMGFLFFGSGALYSFFLVFFFLLGSLYLEWYFNKLTWSL